MSRGARLELGDAAVFTEAGPLSVLVGQAAFWRGGCPIVELGSGEISQISADAGFLHINSADPERAAADLATGFGGAIRRPGSKGFPWPTCRHMDPQSWARSGLDP